MPRADVTISSNVSLNHSTGSHQAWGIRNNDDGSLFEFLIDAGTTELVYRSSYDYGLTWSNFNVIPNTAGQTVAGFAVWYDRWTPGDTTGNIAHLWWFETGADDVHYRALNISTEVLGTEAIVFDGASFLGNNAGTWISGCKTIGGNLLVGFDGDGGTEKGFYRSTDSGANWSARTDWTEGADYAYVMPGFAADTNDAIIIFWDRSASELSRKLYSDAGNTTSESSIATAMTSIASTTCTPQFTVTVDDANNKIMMAAWSNRDLANADLRFWNIDESAITEATNVVLNSGDDQQMCALSLNTGSALLTCYYGGKSDGSETAGTSINIYYKQSSDQGTTWGAETLISKTTRNHLGLWSVPVVNGPSPLYARYMTSAAPRIIYLSILAQSNAIFGGGMVR